MAKWSAMEDKPNLKVEKGKKTVARLLEKGRQLFAEKGYAGVSAEEIVAAAGVTRGALYHHFDGKKGLFLAVVRTIHEEIMREVQAATDREPDPFRMQIAGNDAFLDSASRPEARRILLIDAPAVLGWEAWRELDEEYVLGSYKAFLAALAEKGLIKPYPAAALAHIISGAANEGVFYIAGARDRARALSEVRETMAGLIESLRP